MSVPAPAPASEQPPRRRRRWLRWLWRGLLLFVLLLVALRIAVPLLAPTGARLAGGALGLDIELANLDLALLQGRGAIDNLVVRPQRPEGEPPAEPLLRLDHAAFDLDLRALRSGRLRVARLEADGVAVRVLRRADGRFEVEELFPPSTEPPEPEEEEPEERKPLDLTLPLELGALRAQGLTIAYRDESFDPPLELTLAASARLTDLGSPDRPATLELLARSPGLLGMARLSGTIESAGPRHSARLRAELDRLRPGAVAPLLARMGLRPRAEELSGGLGIELDAGPAEGAPAGEALRAELALVDLALREDGVETAGLEELRVVLAPLSAEGLTVELVRVQGGHVDLARAADGAPGVAGLELMAATPGPEGAQPVSAPAPASQGAPEPKPAAEEPAPEPGFAFGGVELLTLGDLRLRVEDRSSLGAEPLELALEQLELRDLVPAEDGGRADLRATFAAPGLLERARLEGPIELGGGRYGLELALAVEGLRGERLEPWLAPLGIEPTLQDGQFEGKLTGSWRVLDGGAGEGGLALEGVRLADEAELAALDRLALEEVVWRPGEGLRIGSIELQGTRMAVRRDAEDAWRLFGLRVGLPAASAPATPEAETAAAPEGAASSQPTPGQPTPGQGGEAEPPAVAGEPAALLGGLTFELGRLSWSDARLELVDEDPERPLELVLDDVGLELERLVLGAEPGGPAPPPARLALHFAADGLAQRLALEGTLQSDPGRGLDADLALEGRGLTLRAVAPLLEELAGLRSELEAAELDLRLQGGFRMAPGGVTAQLELSGVRFADGGEELAGLDALSLKGLELGAGGVALEELAVRSPRARVARAADGSFGALGLWLVGRPPQPEPERPQPAVEEGNPLDAAVALLRQRIELPQLTVGRLALEDAALAFRDAALEPAAELRLGARFELRGLELGSATPASFEGALGLEGGPDELALTGELSTDPADLAVRGELRGRGLRAGALSPYLPPGIEVALQDGRLALAFEAGFGTAEAGGRSLRALATGLELAEGERVLLALERAAAVAPRLDPDAQVYEFGELTLRGLELDARRTERGLEALGVVVALAPPPDAGEGAPEDPAPAAEDSAALAAEEPAPAAEEPAPAAEKAEDPLDRPVPWWANLRFEGPDLPDARLESLDVGLARLTFLDETRAGAQPLELSARATTPGPQVLFDDDPAALPPLELKLVSSAKPIVDVAETSLRLAPFKLDPRLGAELLVSGIRGAGIAEVLPELGELIGGSRLDGGELRARLDGELRWARRGPADFDLSRGFAGELEVDELALRDGPDGELLAGVDAIDVELKTVRPLSGLVHVRSVEIERPYARVLRDAEGIHVFGITIRVPESSGEPATAAADSPEELERALEAELPAGTQVEVEGGAAPGPELAAVEPQPAPESAPESGSAPAPAPRRSTGELRIDRLRVSGIDLVVRDTTVEPALHYPIDDLDLTVDGLTTRALTEERAIVYSLDVAGGAVELPEHYPQKSLVSGVIGLAGGLVTREGERPLEERPVFGSIYSTGRLALYPRPSGWVSLRVTDFELLPFRGYAGAAKVDLRDGLVEARVEARLEDERFKLKSRTVYRSLSVSEPVGGPITGFVGVPAPLDTVLWALRNDAGEQVVSLKVDMAAGDGVGFDTILGQVAKVLTSVLMDAVTSAPKRVLDSVSDLPVIAQVTGALGKVPGLKWLFGEDAALAYTGRGYELHFPPGGTTIGQAELARMREMLAAMGSSDSVGLVLTHELGGGDLARAELLANPEPQDVREIALRLRQRKAELLRRRSQVSGELEALYAAGRSAQAEAPRAELQRLDVELGETEEGLDSVLELLEGSAGRRRDRRTREGALAIARERLRTVRERLAEELDAEAAVRVETRPPRFSRPEDDAGGAVTVRVVRVK